MVSGCEEKGRCVSRSPRPCRLYLNMDSAGKLENILKRYSNSSTANRGRTEES